MKAPWREVADSSRETTPVASTRWRMFVGSAIVLGILAMDRAEPEVTARGSVRRAADGTFMVDVAFDVHDAQKCRARNRVVVVTVPDLSSEAVEFACVAPEALEPLGPN